MISEVQQGGTQKISLGIRGMASCHYCPLPPLEGIMIVEYLKFEVKENTRHSPTTRESTYDSQKCKLESNTSQGQTHMK